MVFTSLSGRLELHFFRRKWLQCLLTLQGKAGAEACKSPTLDSSAGPAQEQGSTKPFWKPRSLFWLCATSDPPSPPPRCAKRGLAQTGGGRGWGGQGGRTRPSEAAHSLLPSHPQAPAARQRYPSPASHTVCSHLIPLSQTLVRWRMNSRIIKLKNYSELQAGLRTTKHCVWSANILRIPCVLFSSMSNLMKMPQTCRSFCCHKACIFVHPLFSPLGAKEIFGACIYTTHNQSLNNLYLQNFIKLQHWKYIYINVFLIFKRSRIWDNFLVATFSGKEQKIKNLRCLIFSR